VSGEKRLYLCEMKPTLLLAFLLIGFSIKAQQIDFRGDKSVTIKNDSVPIEQSFKLAKKLLGLKNFYFDRYVLRKDTLYYRPGIRIFRRRTYIVSNGDLIILRK